jgi:N-acetylneuraminic acid mutarotase
MYTRTMDRTPVAIECLRLAVRILLNLFAVMGTDGADAESSLRWSKLADRHGHAAVAIDGKILVIGGYGEGGAIAVVEQYDPKTDDWKTRAPMPTARGFLGAALVGSKVYAVGGRVHGRPPVESYDIGANHWERLDPMPGPARNRFGIAVLGTTIYVLGGEPLGDSALPKSVLKFEPTP